MSSVPIVVYGFEAIVVLTIAAVMSVFLRLAARASLKRALVAGDYIIIFSLFVLFGFVGTSGIRTRL